MTRAACVGQLPGSAGAGWVSVDIRTLNRLSKWKKFVQKSSRWWPRTVGGDVLTPAIIRTRKTKQNPRRLKSGRMAASCQTPMTSLLEWILWLGGNTVMKPESTLLNTKHRQTWLNSPNISRAENVEQTKLQTKSLLTIREGSLCDQLMLVTLFFVFSFVLENLYLKI